MNSFFYYKVYDKVLYKKMICIIILIEGRGIGEIMEFDVKKVTEEIIEFIRDYYKKYNLKGAVIGISGGKDSAVVGALFSKALGSENVLGLWLPCHSKESDKEDALLISKTFSFELKEFDLTNIYDNYVKSIKQNNKVLDNDLIDANINLKPRLRMNTMYYYASMMSKIKNGIYLVCGTSNKSELYVGYFTKGGDSVSDINVLRNLYVDEVIKIGDYLGVPYHICHKTPDDGLSNMSDEEKLGFSYDNVKKVSLEEEFGIKDNTINNKIRNKIIKSHLNNQHKFNIPSYKRSL